MVAFKTELGNSPESLLLLRSSSNKYFKLLTSGTAPTKLLLFAWKMVTSSNLLRKLSSLSFLPPKLNWLNWMLASARSFVPGNFAHSSPMYLSSAQMSVPTHVLSIFFGSFSTRFWNFLMTGYTFSISGLENCGGGGGGGGGGGQSSGSGGGGGGQSSGSGDGAGE